MSKVKKLDGLTGVRNVKAAKRGARKAVATAPKPAKKVAKAAGKGASKVPVRGTKKAAKKVVRKAAKKVVKKVAKRGGRKVVLTVVKGAAGRAGKLAPIVRFAIKELDPIHKCGPDTSVQFLYRVDESVEGRTTPHLVFFDRHGWYCEHGRTCPAVAPARKHNGHIARVS